MLIRDIAEYLQANGVGSIGTNIFLGTRPDSPDNVVCLFPTGGFAQNLALDDVRMTVQVLVRDKSYPTCYNRIWQVFNLLDKTQNRLITAPSGRKMVVRAMQPPFLLERDANNRVVFVFNAAVWTRRD